MSKGGKGSKLLEALFSVHVWTLFKDGGEPSQTFDNIFCLSLEIFLREVGKGVDQIPNMNYDHYRRFNTYFFTPSFSKPMLPQDQCGLPTLGLDRATGPDRLASPCLSSRSSPVRDTQPLLSSTLDRDTQPLLDCRSSSHPSTQPLSSRDTCSS